MNTRVTVHLSPYTDTQHQVSKKPWERQQSGQQVYHSSLTFIRDSTSRSAAAAGVHVRTGTGECSPLSGCRSRCRAFGVACAAGPAGRSVVGPRAHGVGVHRGVERAQLPRLHPGAGQGGRPRGRTAGAAWLAVARPVAVGGPGLGPPDLELLAVHGEVAVEGLVRVRVRVRVRVKVGVRG